MKLANSLGAALLLSIAATVVGQTFTDPANLRGERVRPRDGRELPIDQGASGLQQLLRKLNTRASLMLIVAHPDDEDGGMLTLYSRGLGARVAVLTLNRGEGGQNAMTGDFDDALGLLRTQELLSADRYFDVDQMFGTEVDFGFSKTKEESFAKWTHERVLYDAVRAVRLYRPLVIASVFIGGVTDGHGQHQVSGQIAQEVFNAAGDPKVFPELTAEGILPWQPLKVYARVPTQSITAQGLFDYATGLYTPARFTNYVTGEVTTTEPSVDVVVHEGITDPLLADTDGKPRSYVQFARIGLGLQRSQIGPGARSVYSGAYDISYHRYGSRLAKQAVHEERFFDGIDTSVEGISALAPDATGSTRVNLKVNLNRIASKIAEAQKIYTSTNPDSGLEALRTALDITDGLISNFQSLKPELLPAPQKLDVLHELRIKRVQFNDALVLGLGLRFDATAAKSDEPVQSAFPVHTRITTSTKEPVGRFTQELRTKQGNVLQRGGRQDGPVLVLAPDRPWQEDINITPAITGSETRPYFYRENIEQPVYQLHDTSLRNAPSTPPALTAWANLFFRRTAIEMSRVVEASGQPVSFVPPASVLLTSHSQVLPEAQDSLILSAMVSPPGTRTETKSLEGWKVTPYIQYRQKSTGLKQLRLTALSTNRRPCKVHVIAVVEDGKKVTEGYRPIGYGDLPRTNYYTPATIRVVPVDLKLPTRHRIAYLPGTGDAVPEALTSIGLTPTLLSVADLTPIRLAQFDTVILGVRTYNAHPDLHGAPTQQLLDYAHNGGNVIVQFQTGEFTAADAPFSLTLGYAEKVVDETVPVQLLNPAAPLFNAPNHITPADFNNWVEERGHGFLRTWDPRYTALTETHDPGQAPQRGGLITTPLGKGRWTYCAFALYRQLPEAVPGAFRLFANLLNP